MGIREELKSFGEKLMKFIVDNMLGKLSRWLCIMGFDAKYSRNLDDDDIIIIARNEKRIILTKDVGLYKKALYRNLETYYVEGNTEQEKLADLSLKNGLKLELELSETRCPFCNKKLKRVNKKEVEHKLEKRTLGIYNDFWQCLECKKVYWHGSHWKKIFESIKKAEKIKNIRLLQAI